VLTETKGDEVTDNPQNNHQLDSFPALQQLLSSYTDYTQTPNKKERWQGLGKDWKVVTHHFPNQPQPPPPLERRKNFMLFSLVNFNTTSWEKSRSGKPTRGSSIPVRLRIPSYVKETIRSIAKEKGTNASQLIRLALFSCFHISIPQHNSNEAAKDRVTFRLS
jgi:hypothetical protein